ncbi:NAD-dependent epimerase/dehydratase family protein [Nocardia sp. NPDC006044]|uniref:NAD-dependent epimerase/dehydratase family protein n=1 Tax=Nocardia sp. NPDC006044 TaxID=3364306 RepID=UPI0036CA5F55
MKVLVTGASGFLGGALVNRLVREGEHEVAVLARPTSDLRDICDLDRIRIVPGDLGDASSLTRATVGVDIVFHAAARVDERGTRTHFWNENVCGTERLLSAARRAGTHQFIFISSPSALMDRDGGDQIDIDESVPYPERYLNLYSETKAAAERAVLAADASGFRTCALRPRAIWGAGDRSGPIIRLLERTAQGKLPDLSFGRDVYASLCHIDNIVDACVKASTSERVGGKAYFIADGEQTDVWKFLAEVAGRLGYPAPSRTPDPRLVRAAVAVIEAARRIPAVAGRWAPPLSRYTVALLTRTATYDTSAAATDFGYHPIVDRERGLAEFLRWLDGVGGVAELWPPTAVTEPTQERT